RRDPTPCRQEVCLLRAMGSYQSGTNAKRMCKWGANYSSPTEDCLNGRKQRDLSSLLLRSSARAIGDARRDAAELTVEDLSGRQIGRRPFAAKRILGEFLRVAVPSRIQSSLQEAIASRRLPD